MPFWQGSHFFISWSRGDCYISLSLTKRRRFAAALLPLLFGNNVPGHTTRVPTVGFELASRVATNGIQFYAIANLDKTNQSSFHCTT